jgi:hypothetical protein
LTFFVHLKWMPPQRVVFWSGATKSNPQELFGTSLTIHMNSSGKRGHASYHQLNVEVEGKVRELTTVLVDCTFASAGTK